MPAEECLAKLLPQGVGLTYVEVGVFRARNLVALANMYPLLQITGVDSYQPYSDPAHGSYRVSEALSAYNRGIAEKAIAGCPGASRIKLVVEDSSVYAATVPDASLDVVFLDKGFSVESQRQDILDWYSKVKGGGIFCGHDAGTDVILAGVMQGLASVSCTSPVGVVDNEVWFLRKDQ